MRIHFPFPRSLFLVPRLLHLHCILLLQNLSISKYIFPFAFSFRHSRRAVGPFVSAVAATDAWFDSLGFAGSESLAEVCPT